MSSSRYLRSKALFLGVLLSIITASTAYGQTCPVQGTEIFPNLTGQELIDALVAEYKTSTVLSYEGAREEMYGNIDNSNGIVEGIYTGYLGEVDPSQGNIRSQATSQNINAEHSWPQSKGAIDGTNAHSDMHHLYPAFSSANSSRGNQPYAEIPDSETDAWWLYDQQYTTPAGDSIDYYSERMEGHPSGLNHPSGSEYDSWEPREQSEGDIARSMFYFYTMYKDQADEADPLFFEVQKQFLRTWNQLDAVSEKEYQRTCAIAPFQDDKVNPFVIDPTLVERAFFQGAVSQTNVYFSASELNVNEALPSIQVQVAITNPNPDTATTVNVVYDGGTATASEDFETFTSQTVTFPEGSLERQTVSITLIDDELEETPETISLRLESVSGPENAVIGEPEMVEISITDNDGEMPTTAWVNELHYDNESTDEGEFVELAVNAEFADLTNVNLTLYNGSNGSSYATYSGTDFQRGETSDGFSFYYVDLPSNGIQNGSPDGLSLDIDGQLIQFLSYEGTFTAVDGPAQDFESTDIEAEQTGSTPVGSSLSLGGTGLSYEEFSWEVTDAHTKGDINTNQTLGEPVVFTDTVSVAFADSALAIFEDQATVTVSLQITNPHPDTATTVQVAHIGGTASEDDYETFTTQTLTFPVGSGDDQSFAIQLTDDDLYEKNETIQVAIQSVNGPARTEISTPDTLHIFIRNDDKPQLGYLDYWINEFHYQNAGADTNEFVEIARNLGLVTKQSNADHELVLTLYNGSNGSEYASYTNEDLIGREAAAGFQLYYIETEGLQNGDPDGISLSVDGELSQFISYGGTFVAMDGPAKDYESIDVGVAQATDGPVTGSISLTGEGQFYNDFTWALSDSASKGSENKGQDLYIPVSNETENEIASAFKLNQNYPNPFNPSTIISYQLAENSTVSLQVFDMLGREVATLIQNERKAAGSYQITFDAGNLSSGMYLYRLSTSSGIQLTQKMLLMK